MLWFLVGSLEYNQLKAEGAKHVADAITTNTTLKSLKYALLHPQPCCQDPLTAWLRVYSLDGHPLEIKKLKGEEPVEKIDLSGKRLTELSAIVIASLLPLNTATKSLE